MEEEGLTGEEFADEESTEEEIGKGNHPVTINTVNGDIRWHTRGQLKQATKQAALEWDQYDRPNMSVWDIADRLDRLDNKLATCILDRLSVLIDDIKKYDFKVDADVRTKWKVLIENRRKAGLYDYPYVPTNQKGQYLLFDTEEYVSDYTRHVQLMTRSNVISTLSVLNRYFLPRLSVSPEIDQHDLFFSLPTSNVHDFTQNELVDVVTKGFNGKFNVQTTQVVNYDELYSIGEFPGNIPETMNNNDFQMFAGLDPTNKWGVTSFLLLLLFFFFSFPFFVIIFPSESIDKNFISWFCNSFKK